MVVRDGRVARYVTHEIVIHRSDLRRFPFYIPHFFGLFLFFP